MIAAPSAAPSSLPPSAPESSLRRPTELRNRYLFACDLVAFCLAPAAAYLIRFEGAGWSPADRQTLVVYTVAATGLKLGIGIAMGLYRRYWPQAGTRDLIQILLASLVAAIATVLLGAGLLPRAGLVPVRVPLSVLALDAFFSATALAALRLLAKGQYVWRQRHGNPAGRRVLIVGAGAGGEMIAREIRSNPRLGITPVGFADDDPAKRSLRVMELPVLCSLAGIPAAIREHGIEEVIIAMPSAPGRLIRAVHRAAADAGVPTRTMPGMFEILSGRVSTTALRRVEIQDLLRRAPVETDVRAVRALVADRTVLVTGAGGSIGSELCRQLARLEPDRLVLLGHGEHSIFTMLAELGEAFPGLRTVPVIADVRHGARIEAVFHALRPDVVFHAAAHKHVPLMEANVAEAITNNVLGTLNVISAAVAAGTGRLVLVSSDKAVRPCSVMGRTKRVAEMLVQRAAATHGRNFVAVRFGNVLGSRGSVVPTFLRQIEAGGPVTVTHPDMKRYFMTIPEAVQLVLQAAALGRGGEVFVLDMGEPVRIVDLARDLIRLSGLEPETDIEIRFTGSRPGERLAEEVVFGGETVAPTAHPKVLRATNERVPARVAAETERLINAARGADGDEHLRQALARLIVEEESGELALPLQTGTRAVSDAGRGDSARRAPAPARIPAPAHPEPAP